jgi:hypothetical protein
MATPHRPNRPFDYPARVKVDVGRWDMKNITKTVQNQVGGRSRVVWRQEERAKSLGNFLKTERRVWKVCA